MSMYIKLNPYQSTYDKSLIKYHMQILQTFYTWILTCSNLKTGQLFPPLHFHIFFLSYHTTAFLLTVEILQLTKWLKIKLSPDAFF